VVALTPNDEYAERLAAHGIAHHPIVMDKQGTSPVRDGILFLRYLRALRRIRPAVFLGYTAKPNVYGSLAAHALGIPVINNVAGLGTAFIREGLLTKIVLRLYKLAFRKAATVFFQNGTDMAMFTQLGIVRADQARLLPGSGIDLARYTSQPREGEGFAFLLVARLLWDKGIGEYVEAARTIRARRPDVSFRLLGFLDVANRTAVSREDVAGWTDAIDYLGATDDVRPFIAEADSIVLPSYREGLPRVLLEGAAMGKPLIATDVPGCRDVVEEGVNGFLCAARDGASLAEAMERLLDLSAEERRAMGEAGRRRVEREFDQRIVSERYAEAIARATGL
jgi:glycosyltransferase involved in cell wall biosynthesis